MRSLRSGPTLPAVEVKQKANPASIDVATDPRDPRSGRDSKRPMVGVGAYSEHERSLQEANLGGMTIPRGQVQVPTVHLQALQQLVPGTHVCYRPPPYKYPAATVVLHEITNTRRSLFATRLAQSQQSSSMIGKLVHYTVDAVLLSTVVAGVRRSSGFG